MTSNCSHPPGGDQDTLNVTDAAEFQNSVLNTINLGKRTGCTGKDQSEIYGKHKYVNVVKHKHYTHTHTHTLLSLQISTSEMQTFMPTAQGKSLAAGTNEVPAGSAASHLLLSFSARSHQLLIVAVSLSPSIGL